MQPRRAHRRGGSTLVETALCLIFVLLPMVLGGLQFGLVLTTTHALQEVSREAGRFAAVHYGEPTFDSADTQGDKAGDVPSLDNYLKDVARANKIPWNDIKNNIVVNPATSSARASGQPITVSITYPMRNRSIIGQLGFWKAKKPVDAKGRLPEGVVQDTPLSLSVLSKDYTVSSTFIMQ